MKSALLFFAAVLPGAMAFAQSDKQQAPARTGSDVVYYRLIYDKPQEIKMMSLMLPLWNLAGSKINSSIYDLNTSLLYTDTKFQGLVRYKMGLGDKIAPETYEGAYPNHPLMFSINEVPKSQEFSAIGTYFLEGEDVIEEQRVKLKREGNVETVTDIPVSAYKSMGINLGYSQGFTWYNMNNTNVNAVLRDDASEQTYKLASMSTIQNYKFVKIGATFLKTVDMKAEFDGYGIRDIGIVKTTWVNVIGAVQNQFDDVYVPVSGGADNDLSSSQTVYVTKANINDHNKKLAVGFEFGQRYSFKRSFFSFEYGVKYLPGLMNNLNFMIDLGLNININFLRGR